MPICGAAAFVLGALAANSGQVIAVNSATGVLEGILIPVAVVAGAEVIAAVLLAILLAVLIYTIIQSLLDKMPRLYLSLRHYTTYENAPRIWASKYIWETSDWVETDLQFPGVYLTDIKTQPNTLTERIAIASALRIPPPPQQPDPTRVTSYIDILIDRLRVLLITAPIIYDNQYLYPTIISGGLREDGNKIIFQDHGSFLPPVL